MCSPFGKWGIGEPGTTGLPTRQGFDYFYGYLNQTNAHFYYPPFLWRNEERVLLEGNDPVAQVGVISGSAGGSRILRAMIEVGARRSGGGRFQARR